MTVADAVNPSADVLDLEERRWLPRHGQGDTRAFGQLVKAYQGLVYTFLHRYGVAVDQRDDLFQEIFLRIHQAAASYRASQPLRPWLVTIVLNTVRNFHRQQRRFLGIYTTPASEVVSADPPPEDQTEHDATLVWLEGRISQLPRAQREVLALSTLKDMRIKEVAEILRLPENTVKTHLRRARLALAEALALRQSEERPE